MKNKVRIIFGSGHYFNQAELVYRLDFQTNQDPPWPSYIVKITCPACEKKFETRIKFPDDVHCMKVLCGKCSVEFRTNCKPVNCKTCEDRIECLLVETIKIPFKRTYRQEPSRYEKSKV